VNVFDLIKNVSLYVQGACLEWNRHYKQFDANGEEFQRFCERTTEIVFAYIRGKKTLDGSCSDFECTLSIDASKVFGLNREESLADSRIRNIWLHSGGNIVGSEKVGFTGSMPEDRLLPFLRNLMQKKGA
jgi:hypothetical protein